MPAQKRPLAILAGLLGLSCLVQVLLVARATVPAQDAVHFVAIARGIDRDGVLDTARGQREQPLFPLSIWLAQEGLRATIGMPKTLWATSAQLAATVPLVLAIVPVYLTSLRLVGCRAALAGSLLFCVLPEVCRLGADGISDSTHLLFFCLAFWMMVGYFSSTGADASTNRSVWWLVAAGVSTGVAVLARAEVLVLLAVFIVCLVLFQFQASRRQPWLHFALAAGCLLLGFGLLLGPYLAAMGCLAPKEALARAMGRYEPQFPERLSGPEAVARTVALDQLTLPDGRPLSFADSEPTSKRYARGWAAVGLFGEELADAYGYWVAGFAVLGLWLLRHRSAGRVRRFVQVFFAVYCLAVFQFTAREGYLSARHLLAVVVPGLGYAGYGLLAAGSWLWSRRAKNGGPTADRGRWPLGGRSSSHPGGTRPPASGFRFPQFTFGPWPAGWAFVSLAVAACLVGHAAPLHVNRLGHRRAGQWLAECADLPGSVLDTRGWTAFYSGRRTYRYTDARAAFSDPRLTYVVLERRELHSPSDRSRTLGKLLRAAAEPVASFSAADRRDSSGHDVLVFRWDADRFVRSVAAMTPPEQSKEERHVARYRRVSPDRGGEL